VLVETGWSGISSLLRFLAQFARIIELIDLIIGGACYSFLINGYFLQML